MLTAVLLGITVVTSLLTVLMLGALVELYRQIAELRGDTGLLDLPMTLEGEFGLSLPVESITYREPPELARGTDRCAILFLSDSCTTCELVAKGIPSKRTPRLMVVVESMNASAGEQWISKIGLPGMAEYDHDRRAASALGVEVIPSVVMFDNRQSVGMYTVPSARHVSAILDWVNGVDAHPFSNVGPIKEVSSEAVARE